MFELGPRNQSGRTIIGDPGNTADKNCSFCDEFGTQATKLLVLGRVRDPGDPQRLAVDVPTVAAWVQRSALARGLCLSQKTIHVVSAVTVVG